MTDWRRDIDVTRTAFFLDVDGTLLGFRERPEDVVADASLLDLLGRLREASGGALALVSGRAIPDLDRIMAPMILPAAGIHGADLRFADGRRETAEHGALANVRQAASAFVTEHAGLTLEDKGATIAIHYRRAPDAADRVRAFLASATRDEPDLMVQHGKMVVEVKSRHADKGTAIATLMGSAPFQGRVPLFMGDDLTDEHGFKAVDRLGGVTIKVGDDSEPTSARRRLGDPSAVRDFLASL